MKEKTPAEWGDYYNKKDIKLKKKIRKLILKKEIIDAKIRALHQERMHLYE